MKNIKRIISVILVVFMLMPIMTAWINAAAISSSLDGETSRSVKTLYPGVTRTNIKTSSSSKYQTQNFNIVEFDPKQSDLYVDVTNERDYANQSKTTLNTVKDFNSNNDDGKTAIAAINGDLWMMSSTHSRVEGSGTSYSGYTDAVVTKALTMPRGFSVYNGEIITSAHMPQETPFEGEFWSFGMSEDHVPMIGCPELEIAITDHNNNNTVYADGLNRLPANNALVVYSDKGCLNNYALADAYEVLIKIDSDYTIKHGVGITGTIVGLYTSLTPDVNPEMQDGYIILTARGSGLNKLIGFDVQDRITLEFSVSERYNRNTAGWQTVQNAVGGHAPFVVDGVKWEISVGNNYPSTIVGIKNDGKVVFITDDYGVAGERSGLDSEDYWDFADDMDLNTAFLLDGGGSTTLVELGDSGYSVVNCPTDGSARSVVNSVILSAGPVDTNRGSYNVRYPTENTDLTNINFATDDGFMLLTNYIDTKAEKTLDGAKLMVSDLCQGPSVTISFGLPNTASKNSNSALGTDYQKLTVGHTNNASCFLVLDMAIVSAYSGTQQNMNVWVTRDSLKAPASTADLWNTPSLENNNGFKKYNADIGIKYSGTLNTVRLNYLIPQDSIETVRDGDYVLLRSARLFSMENVNDALNYINGGSFPVMQTVTLDSNGGECEQTVKYSVVGDSYGSFPTPTRDGYEFKGWYTSATGGSKVTADNTVTSVSSRTLYAQWEKKEAETEYFYITFNPNGGDGMPANYPILSGQTYESAIKSVRGVGIHDIPAKNGCTFDGWYCEETGYKLKLSDTFNATENLTFKAVWKQRAGQYTCTASSTLTIRSGPGTTYTQLGTIPNGGIFEATGEYNGKWVKGSYGGITGWASTTYLEYVPSLSSDEVPGFEETGFYWSRYAVLNVEPSGGVCDISSGAVSNSVSVDNIGLDGTESEFDIYVYQSGNTVTDNCFNNYFGVIYDTDGNVKSSSFYNLGDLLNVILRSCNVDGTQADGLDFMGMKTFNADELVGNEAWVDKDLLNGSSYDVTVKCNSYTLTLDTAGGTMPEGYKTSYTFKGGNQKFVDVIGGFPVPTRAGYEFTGWRWLEHSSMQWNDSWGTQPFTFGKSITVTALWERAYEEGSVPELGEDENGKHIYIDGVIQTEGLYEVDGNYYYALRDGSLANDTILYTYHNNTDLVSSYRYFAEDCKMQKEGWLTLDDDSGRTYYFNSAFHAVGATGVDGNYYFFMKNSGEMVRNKTLFVDKNNSAGLEAGIYSFGTDGKMTTAVAIAEAEFAPTLAATAAPVSGLDNYVQNTSVLAINTAAPVSLPEVSKNNGSDDDE